MAAVDRQQLKVVCRVVSLCVAWYAISSSNNVVGKMLLTDFQYPMTVSMVQLLTNAALSGPLFAAWGVRPLSADLGWSYYLKMVVPLAVGKFASSVFSHVSILKMPVSYAHTVKAIMPLFTVILSRVILGETQTLKVYLSLVPIICGVLIATVTEISFDTVGLISALIATLGFSLQNIFSKKVLKDTGIHHLRLLHLLAKWALCMFLPMWFLYDFRSILSENFSTNGELLLYSMFLLAVAGLLNFAQNIVAFSILNLVTPLTYSICNTTKRISVIFVSLILLQNPVTPANVFGMLLTVVGVLGYNKAKYDAMQLKSKHSILPMSISSPHNHVFSSTVVPAEMNHVPNGKGLMHLSNGNIGSKSFWS